MTINKIAEGNKLILAVEGRVDTSTAPELEEVVNAVDASVTELEFDLAKLDYISSAGLRVLLAAQKLMNKQGAMVVRNVNETIMEIFDVTGFVDILDIQ